MSCGVDRRRGSDPALLWLWCRPAATALIGPLAWEAPYAAGAAQEMAKGQKKKQKQNQKQKFTKWKQMTSDETAFPRPGLLEVCCQILMLT